jgi:hypothetical protein
MEVVMLKSTIFASKIKSSSIDETKADYKLMQKKYEEILLEFSKKNKL